MGRIGRRRHSLGAIPADRQRAGLDHRDLSRCPWRRTAVLHEQRDIGRDRQQRGNSDQPHPSGRQAPPPAPQQPEQHAADTGIP